MKAPSPLRNGVAKRGEKWEAENRLEALLMQGLSSPETKLTRHDLKEVRKQAVARLRTRNRRD